MEGSNNETLTRLTVTLSRKRHQALKEASARSGKTLGQIVEESLEFYGVKTREQASELVTRARNAAGLKEKQALDIALKETRSERKR
jgi:hypothetical protein